MVADLRKRLAKLESALIGEPADEAERQALRAEIRSVVEHANRCRESRGEEPYFEIDEDGVVYTLDGWLVDNLQQTIAEPFYQMEVEWHEEGVDWLVFDEEHESFYTPSGELALSRDCLHLERVFRS
jgi:hypothetical protein